MHYCGINKASDENQAAMEITRMHEYELNKNSLNGDQKVSKYGR